MDEINYLLKNLVEIRSVNPFSEEMIENYNGESSVSKYLINYIKENMPYMTVWEEEVLHNRPNVYALLEIDDTFPTILLETHMDTVDISTNMKSPFDVKKVGGKYYGRGVCDAKGQIVSMILGVKEAYEKSKGDLNCNLLLCFVADEEHKHRGVDKLVKDKINFDFAIVGEPTNLNFAAFHKGSTRFKIGLKGKSCHSSVPENGINSIILMAKVINAFEEHIIPNVEKNIHSKCGASKLSINIIKGGTQPNIIPDYCEIWLDRRLNPDEKPSIAISDIKDNLKKVIDKDIWEKIDWKDPFLVDPPLNNDLNNKYLTFIQKLLISKGFNFEYIGVQFGCDASKLSILNKPVVVFGPGNIEQAHTDNEWIEEKQIIRAISIYSEIIMNMEKTINE